MADAVDLKSIGIHRVGSNPTTPTKGATMDYEYVDETLETIYSLVEQLQEADLEDPRVSALLVHLQSIRQDLWILLEEHL